MKTLMSLCAAAALGLLLFAGLGCEYNHYDDDHRGHGHPDRVYYHDDFGDRHDDHHHRRHNHWRHDGYHRYYRN
jgi:hypothetical protein